MECDTNTQESNGYSEKIKFPKMKQKPHMKTNREQTRRKTKNTHKKERNNQLNSNGYQKTFSTVVLVSIDVIIINYLIVLFCFFPSLECFV